MAPRGRKNTKKKTKTQEEHCVIDDEMQIRTTTMKSLEKTVTNPIPSTVPKNSKESDVDVQVCTGITSDETENSSSGVRQSIVDYSSSDKKQAATAATQLAPPPSSLLPTTETSKTVIFENDIPLQKLGDIETDVVIKAVTDIIYSTC